MKKWIIVIVAVIAVGAIAYFFLTKEKDESGGLNISKKDAVCIIDGVALRDEAGPDGKFVATINFGEKLRCLDEKEVKSKKYIKVELKGGNSGWMKESCLVLAAKPAVIVKDGIVYQRPDLITKTAKVFSSFDIVAIKEKQGDFIQVYGRTKNGKKVSGGWVKSDVLSLEDVDVAVAIYVAKANTIKNLDQRKAALKEIVDNSDFRNSVFISDLSAITAEESATYEEGYEETEAQADSLIAE